MTDMLKLNIFSLSLNSGVVSFFSWLEHRLSSRKSTLEIEEEDSVRVTLEIVLENILRCRNVDSSNPSYG